MREGRVECAVIGCGQAGQQLCSAIQHTKGTCIRVELKKLGALKSALILRCRAHRSDRCQSSSRTNGRSHPHPLCITSSEPL